jgi:hypothetical protein
MPTMAEITSASGHGSPALQRGPAQILSYDRLRLAVWSSAKAEAQTPWPLGRIIGVSGYWIARSRLRQGYDEATASLGAPKL